MLQYGETNNPLAIYIYYMIPIIDLHQDLLLYVSRPDLYKDTDQTSFEKIKKNNIKIVIASAFPMPPDENFLDPITNDLIEKDLIAYNDYCLLHKEFIIIKNYADVERVLSTDGLFGLVLHVEGLNAFNPDIDWKRLEKWYDLGLRSIGPVWNLDNPFGGGTLSNEIGLTDLGRELLEWLSKKGMLIDCAHMNEKTFLDSTKIIKKPIFVSHGNARSLCENVRNYSDEQLRMISKTKGAIGIFFPKRFITTDKNPDMKNVISHFNYIRDVAGVDTLCIGSDFGGIVSGCINEMRSVDNLPDLANSLRDYGYTEEEINKVFYLNAKKILKEYLT